ncbi:DUF3187 family protein [Shewanella sp. GXUN23E]|uniref:DUF3187 family protein n=1 Tax=Shewanella sp. GXUN23E TaxID=3422498 RepID=UPI003D7EC678
MKKLSSILIAGGVCLWSLSLAVSAQNDWGPLRLYAQAPMQTSNLTPVLRSGFAREPGDTQMNMSATAASVWADNDDFLADYYHNTLSIELNRQLTADWQFEFNYRWRFSGDNHLDNLTIWFHDAFGFSQNGRDLAVKHQNRILVKSLDKGLLDFSGETLTNALTAYLQHQLLQSAAHGLSLGASLYYNTVADGPFAESNFEQAIQLNYSFTHGAHHLYSTAGMSFHDGGESVYGHYYRDHAFTLALAYEYRIGRHSLMAEYHRFQGALKRAGAMSDDVNEAIIGYRYAFDRSAIEFAMIENLLNMDNSTDIALTLGFRYAFR